MPEEHAYFAPSAASRWLLCPMSLSLSEKYYNKDAKSSKYAHEGTICHAVAADCLTKNIAPTDFLGKVIEKVVMTPELVAGIQLYIDEIRGLAKEYKALGGKIEHRVKITEECWGTVDALLWNKDTLLICDLKMGKGVVVSAEDNAQLKIYSIGALKWLREEYKINLTKIVNIIIQPRTPDPIRKYEISRQDLGDWYVGEVANILDEYGKGKKISSSSKCNPGEVQCRWCPVSQNGACAAEAHKAANDAQQAFLPFTKIEKPEVKKTEGELTIEEVVEYKKSFPFILQWIKTIDTFINAKALAGEHIPGFKLVEGRSIRIWNVDEDNVVTFLRNIDEEPYIEKLVSPAQAEKAMGKKTAKSTGLYSLIVKPKGAPTLVAQSDKRPEIQIQPEKEVEESFEVFNEQVSEPLLVDNEDDTEEVKGLSALQRMRLAEEEEEEEEVIEKKIPNVIEETLGVLDDVIESATGGNQKEIISSAKGNGNPIPPAETTKRFRVLEMGEGGETTLKMAAEALGCKETMIKMHLRYLNERDGYSYEIYEDYTFKVKE